ncbi:protoporphyrinogen/coproporphyrinogen oxidase [Streptomyces coeruleoprunus]|uniref:Protoporphyrinogen/coproporphyrinogen oxidase n=1 Tax=Streptomyces coeruleoprunus TaxID=285563 RepID=A0ABV9X7X9_9ACTN
MSARLAVIGAGPTGLGAAHRLRELGHDDFVVLEATGRVGGLARSETDGRGFTYDIGGHVLFSHYPYYTELVERLLGDDFTEIRREASIRMEQRYIPYPFQNNIRGLEPGTVFECLSGLIAAQRAGRDGRVPATFRDWVHATFGSGIARHFMLPYNLKVWATPPEEMGHQWIGERVATVDVDAVLRNVVLGEETRDWGPNSTFRYPLHGGTGHLFERLAEPVVDRVRWHARVVAVDPGARYARTADGRVWAYDALLSTMPLDDLVGCCASAPADVAEAARLLRSTGTHVVGVAVDRRIDSPHTWVYFPEPDVPFYRATYLSSYSPHLVRRPGQTLLLTETSTSAHRPVDGASAVAGAVDGLVRAGLLRETDRSLIVSTWHCAEPKTYPVPTLDRDAALGVIHSWLSRHGIASRGRFGAWRYEIGNMDHSCMQGVEWADHVVNGAPEQVWAS